MEAQRDAGVASADAAPPLSFPLQPESSISAAVNTNTALFFIPFSPRSRRRHRRRENLFLIPCLYTVSAL